jgi:carboxylesterase type B
MSPDGTTNLAVKDLVTALSFLKTVIPSFGGDPSQITLAGQSSGASLIRSLLAVPSASSLFRSAIIQSDPMVRMIVSTPQGGNLDVSVLGFRVPQAFYPTRASDLF